MPEASQTLTVEQLARHLAAQKLGEAQLGCCDLEAQLMVERQATAAVRKELAEVAARLEGLTSPVDPPADADGITHPGGD